MRYLLVSGDVRSRGFPGKTIRALKEKEEKLHGEYRTRHLVLEAFEELAVSCGTGVSLVG